MTFNPYEEEWRAVDEAEKLLDHINLEPDTIPSLKRGLKIIARDDVNAANDLAEAVRDLLESHAARGEIIRQQGATLQALGVEPEEVS